MGHVSSDPLDALIFVPASSMYVPAGVIPEADVMGERDAPIVLHSVNLTKGVDWFRADRRLLKASLLYADRAEVAGLTGLVCAARRHKDIRDHFMDGFPPDFADPGAVLGSPGLSWLLDEVDAAISERRCSCHELPAGEASDARAALEDFTLAIEAGALSVHEGEGWQLGKRTKSSDRDRIAGRLADPSCLPVLGGDRSWVADHVGLEGTLAACLLGDLEGFPDASMDVILDVRQRLELPRIRFRSAVAAASQELADEEPRRLDAALADVRRRVVDPAIAEIREELGALNARSTLLRLASSPVTAGTLAAQLSLAAGVGGAGGLAALARGLLAAPIVAALSKEADYRTTQKRALRLRPYWILHEASVKLRNRV